VKRGQRRAGTRTIAWTAFLACVCPPALAVEPESVPAGSLVAELPERRPPPAPGLYGADWLLATARHSPGLLGPLSIGSPDAGLLLNPRPFPQGPYWTIRDPRRAWATDETIDFVTTAIEAVEARYPGSPRLLVGHISSPEGGRLGRHRSHQTGRDVDLGFYYRRGPVDTFLPARRVDLDLPRTWALVRALVTETDLDRIFVDRTLVGALYQHALAEGEDRAWLDEVFGRAPGGPKGLIQHERLHRDHLHVRFHNPRAQEHARVVYPVLVETGAAPPPTVTHRVRSGETLGSLARRYGTSVGAIRAANGLRGSLLRAGRSYVIPVRRAPRDDGPVVVPPRRLPPEWVARGEGELPAETREPDSVVDSQ
jgi:murein endopeptidase